MGKKPRYHRSNTQEHCLIAFYTTLLQRRRTKRFLSTEKKLRAHPCLSSSHPPQWKRTPLHTMAPETLIFHTPCIWWHLQKQELCNNKSSVHSPSRQAGKVGHREPQNTQLQTHGSAFFFSFPLKSWISRLTTHCQLFKEASRTLMSRRWELGQVPNCGSWAAAGHLQALTSSHRGSGLGLVQSLGMGLLTAVLISTSIPECSKRQAGLGGY